MIRLFLFPGFQLLINFQVDKLEKLKMSEKLDSPTWKLIKMLGKEQLETWNPWIPHINGLV